MDLSSNMDWKEHIDWTVKKVKRCFGFSEKESLHQYLWDQILCLCYSCPSLPTEYCASIWSPHTGQSKQKLEMVQRRSARYCNTSSVTDMLQDLNWETLESRRSKLQLVIMHKNFINLVDIPSDANLTLNKSNLLEETATVPDGCLQAQLLSEDHTCVEFTTSLSCWGPWLGTL